MVKVKHTYAILSFIFVIFLYVNSFHNSTNDSKARFINNILSNEEQFEKYFYQICEINDCKNFKINFNKPTKINRWLTLKNIEYSDNNISINYEINTSTEIDFPKGEEELYQYNILNNTFDTPFDVKGKTVKNITIQENICKNKNLLKLMNDYNISIITRYTERYFVETKRINCIKKQ